MEAEAPSTSEKIPSPGPTAGSTSAAGDANCAGPTEGVDVSVTKCANYLKTLVTLAMAAKGPDEPKAGLRQLVREAIYGSLEADEFAARLQRAMNAQAPPHVLPFLRKTLPLLRQEVKSGRRTIDGIGKPEEYESEKLGKLLRRLSAEARKEAGSEKAKSAGSRPGSAGGTVEKNERKEQEAIEVNAQSRKEHPATVSANAADEQIQANQEPTSAERMSLDECRQKLVAQQAAADARDEALRKEREAFEAERVQLERDKSELQQQQAAVERDRRDVDARETTLTEDAETYRVTIEAFGVAKKQFEAQKAAFEQLAGGSASSGGAGSDVALDGALREVQRLEADLAEMTRQRDAAQDQAQQLQAMYDDAYRSGAEQFDKRRRMRDRIWRVEADLEQALMEKEALEWTVKFCDEQLLPSDNRPSGETAPASRPIKLEAVGLTHGPMATDGSPSSPTHRKRSAASSQVPSSSSKRPRQQWDDGSIVELKEKLHALSPEFPKNAVTKYAAFVKENLKRSAAIAQLVDFLKRIDPDGTALADRILQVVQGL